MIERGQLAEAEVCARALHSAPGIGRMPLSSPPLLLSSPPLLPSPPFPFSPLLGLLPSSPPPHSPPPQDFDPDVEINPVQVHLIEQEKAAERRATLAAKRATLAAKKAKKRAPKPRPQGLLPRMQSTASGFLEVGAFAKLMRAIAGAAAR